MGGHSYESGTLHQTLLAAVYVFTARRMSWCVLGQVVTPRKTTNRRCCIVDHV